MAEIAAVLQHSIYYYRTLLKEEYGERFLQQDLEYIWQSRHHASTLHLVAIAAHLAVNKFQPEPAEQQFFERLCDLAVMVDNFVYPRGKQHVPLTQSCILVDGGLSKEWDHFWHLASDSSNVFIARGPKRVDHKQEVVIWDKMSSLPRIEMPDTGGSCRPIVSRSGKRILLLSERALKICNISDANEASLNTMAVQLRWQDLCEVFSACNDSDQIMLTVAGKLWSIGDGITEHRVENTACGLQFVESLRDFVLFTFDKERRLLGTNLRTGAIVFQTEMPDNEAQLVVASDDLRYVAGVVRAEEFYASKRKLCVWDAGGKGLLWTADFGGCIAFAGDYLYHSKKGEIQRIDPRDASVMERYFVDKREIAELIEVSVKQQLLVVQCQKVLTAFALDKQAIDLPALYEQIDRLILVKRDQRDLKWVEAVEKVNDIALMPRGYRRWLDLMLEVSDRFGLVESAITVAGDRRPDHPAAAAAAAAVNEPIFSPEYIDLDFEHWSAADFFMDTSPHPATKSLLRIPMHGWDLDHIRSHLKKVPIMFSPYLLHSLSTRFPDRCSPALKEVFQLYQKPEMQTCFMNLHRVVLQEYSEGATIPGLCVFPENSSGIAVIFGSNSLSAISLFNMQEQASIRCEKVIPVDSTFDAKKGTNQIIQAGSACLNKTGKTLAFATVFGELWIWDMDLATLEAILPGEKFIDLKYLSFSDNDETLSIATKWAWTEIDLKDGRVLLRARCPFGFNRVLGKLGPARFVVENSENDQRYLDTLPEPGSIALAVNKNIVRIDQDNIWHLQASPDSSKVQVLCYDCKSRKSILQGRAIDLGQERVAKLGLSNSNEHLLVFSTSADYKQRLEVHELESGDSVISTDCPRIDFLSDRFWLAQDLSVFSMGGWVVDLKGPGANTLQKSVVAFGRKSVSEITEADIVRLKELRNYPWIPASLASFLQYVQQYLGAVDSQFKN